MKCIIFTLLTLQFILILLRKEKSFHKLFKQINYKVMDSIPIYLIIFNIKFTSNYFNYNYRTDSSNFFSLSFYFFFFFSFFSFFLFFYFFSHLFFYFFPFYFFLQSLLFPTVLFSVPYLLFFLVLVFCQFLSFFLLPSFSYHFTY